MSHRTPHFAAKKEGRKVVVEIYDDIGPSWFGFVDAKLVSSALKEAGEYDEIEVRINSLGGSAFEGIAIHNLLKQDKAEVTVRVDGVACSSASIIAMAGDKVLMPDSALMMIHEPWVIAMGDEGDLLKAAEMLEKVKQSAVSIYGERSGKDEKIVRGWMAEETWFTGKEAVAAGLADREVADAEMSAPIVPAASERFRKTPEHYQRLVAMSASRLNLENQSVADTQKPAAENEEPEEKTVEQKPEAGGKPIVATLGQFAVGEPLVKAVTQADVTAAAQAAVKAERERNGKINAACLMAKRPELAQKFIDEGASVEDVNAALLKQICADNKPLGDDSNAGNVLPQNTPADPDAAYKAEYAAGRDHHVRQGVTEEQYVMSRRIDDGKAVLSVGSAAKK